MNEPPVDPEAQKLTATLVVRRRINATREKLFAAWTRPEFVVRWWGPQGRRDRRGDAAPPTGVARTHGGSAAAGRPAWPCDQGKFLRGRTGASVRGGGRSRYGK